MAEGRVGWQEGKAEGGSFLREAGGGRRKAGGGAAPKPSPREPLSADSHG
jgi:hypothetical protein